MVRGGLYEEVTLECAVNGTMEPIICGLETIEAKAWSGEQSGVFEEWQERPVWPERTCAPRHLRWPLIPESVCPPEWLAGYGAGRGLNLSLLQPSSFLLRSDVGICTPQEFPAHS